MKHSVMVITGCLVLLGGTAADMPVFTIAGMLLAVSGLVIAITHRD